MHKLGNIFLVHIAKFYLNWYIFLNCIDFLESIGYDVKGIMTHKRWFSRCAESKIVQMINWLCWCEKTVQMRLWNWQHAIFLWCAPKRIPFIQLHLEADDLCQEGLLGFLNAAHTYCADSTVSLKTYACICVQNRLIAVSRFHRKRDNIPADCTISMQEWIGLEDLTLQNSGPEEACITQENMNEMKSQIERKLSVLERQVFTLFLNGYSYLEIAKHLSITSKSVDNAIWRIRHKLQVTNTPR